MSDVFITSDPRLAALAKTLGSRIIVSDNGTRLSFTCPGVGADLHRRVLADEVPDVNPRQFIESLETVYNIIREYRRGRP